MLCFLTVQNVSGGSRVKSKLVKSVTCWGEKEDIVLHLLEMCSQEQSFLLNVLSVHWMSTQNCGDRLH